jgi:hypothetical protein
MDDVTFYVVTLLVVSVVHAVLTVGAVVGVLLWVYRRARDLHEMVVEELAHTRAAADDSRTMLLVVKEWASSARTASKDAAASVVKVAEAAPARAELVRAVEAVPDRTADKVVERLHGDSGPLPSL